VIGAAMKKQWDEARSELAKKLGTREINEHLTPEQQKAEGDLAESLRVLTTGNEFDGPHDLGPVSDSRYAGYHQMAKRAIETLKGPATSPAIGADKLDLGEATVSAATDDDDGPIELDPNGPSHKPSAVQPQPLKFDLPAATAPLSRPPEHSLAPRLRDAIRDVAGGREAVRVRLSDLRKRFPGVPPDELTAAILNLSRRDELALYPFDDPRQIKDADRAAAIESSTGVPQHILYFGGISSAASPETKGAVSSQAVNTPAPVPPPPPPAPATPLPPAEPPRTPTDRGSLDSIKAATDRALGVNQQKLPTAPAKGQYAEWLRGLASDPAKFADLVALAPTPALDRNELLAAVQAVYGPAVHAQAKAKSKQAIVELLKAAKPA
jgi:hypothetical protein